MRNWTACWGPCYSLEFEVLMKTGLAITATLLTCLTPAFSSDDWPMFRGPNAAGVSGNTNLPVEFGPQKNVVWKTALPPGHSSPILVGDRIFLTAVDGEHLFTICLDRATGRVQWRRPVPR